VTPGGRPPRPARQRRRATRPRERSPLRTLLGGLTPRAFLAGYWQKRPLLVRQALPGFADPVDRDALFALSARDDVESRLVFAGGGHRRFRGFDGPHALERLRRLPRSRWTLLVQGVDAHVPAAAALLDRFSFIPEWRRDDVMISCAAPLGSVGPHVDSYDVFLIQGRGRRRWQVEQQPDRALRPGLDLQVLRRFRPEREWTLAPGDMLYVPAGVAHYGVALSECLTYSIGFRAPSSRALLGGYAERLLGAPGIDAPLGDPDLAPQAEPGRISARALRRLRRHVAAANRRLLGSELDAIIGQILTEPKTALSGARRRPLPARSVRGRLKRAPALVRSPSARLAFLRRPDGGADLFANGRRYPLDRALAFAAPLLTGRRTVRIAPATLRLTRFVALLTQLLNEGVLQFTRES
jgi:50S ribosomal protein L16 3-hydroxylase